MPFVPVPDTAEVVIDFLVSGQPTANVLHFKYLGIYNQVALDDLAQSVGFQTGTFLLPSFPVTMQFVGVRVKGLSNSIDLSASSSSGAGVGTALGTQMPNNVSLCLTERTNQTGRSARGRIYCQPPTEGDMVTPNTVNSLYADMVKGWVDHIRSAAISINWSHVIVSRQHNGVRLTTGVTYNVTSVIARNLRVDSQRGRMPSPD